MSVDHGPRLPSSASSRRDAVSPAFPRRRDAWAPRWRSPGPWRPPVWPPSRRGPTGARPWRPHRRRSAGHPTPPHRRGPWTGHPPTPSPRHRPRRPAKMPKHSPRCCRRPTAPWATTSPGSSIAACWACRWAPGRCRPSGCARGCATQRQAWPAANADALERVEGALQRALAPRRAGLLRLERRRVAAALSGRAAPRPRLAGRLRDADRAL